jgi:uncharacterized membrane protein YbhN (UPF0104 family)
MTATTVAETARHDKRKRIIRIAQVAFSVVIVVAIFAYAIPKFANYGSVWAILRTLSWPQLGLLAAATLFNLVTYWGQLMASLPGLTLGQAAVNDQTTTSIANTVPGGVSWPSGSPMRCCAPGGSACQRSPCRPC